MTSIRRQRLVGKHLLVFFKTTHIDRAGETGSQLSKFGEIVTVDAHGWVVAVTAPGDHIHCPASKLYRAPDDGLIVQRRRRSSRPDYIAAEELIRDFHSAKRPVIVRWLDRPAALALWER